MRYVYLFALFLLSCVPAQADLTYTDSGQWTFHNDAVVSDTLLATSMAYGVQLWGTGALAMTDDFYVGAGAEGYRCALLDGLLCLSTTGGAVQMIDASDPHALSLTATVTGLGASPCLLMRDESGTPWLYSASRQGASSILRSRDVTSQPGTAHGTLTLYDDAVGMAASGTTLFVATDSGFEAITVSNHDALARADSALFSGTGAVRAISVADGVCALSLSSGGVRLYDVSTPSAITVLASFAVNVGAYTGATARGVALSTTADSLMVMGDDIGITLWDVSPPGSATLLGYDPRLDTPGFSIAATAYQGCWSGDRGYGALWGHYRAGVNVADLTSATVDSLGRTDGFDYSRDVTVGSQVYSAAGDMGIVCLGLGHLPLASTWGVAVDGTTVYAAGVDAGGFTSIDFSAPDAPAQLDALTTDCRDLVLAGDVAYAAAYTSGLLTVDISDPANLTQLDIAEHGTSTAYGVALSAVGSICATADGADGLNVWDVSDPANLVHLGNVATAGNALDVALGLDGTVAYVVASGAGVQVVDLKDPAAPSAGTAFGSTHASGVTLLAGVLSVAAGSDGVYCYGLAGHPLEPALLDSYNTVGDAHRVAAAVTGGRYTVYVADESGIVELHLDVDAGVFCE